MDNKAKIILTAEADQLQAGLRKANDALDAFKGKSISAAKSAGMAFAGMAAAAAAASGVAFISSLNRAVDTLAKLDDMSQKTGSSVENLSRLEQVASATGASFDGVDGALTKLSKGLAGVNEKGSDTADALKAIGISTRDVAGKDASEVFVMISRALQGYEDGASKVALAQTLMGKSGAEMLPYMNDVAEKIDKFTGHSSAAAQQASAYQDNLALLRVEMDNLAIQVGSAALPAMTDFISSLHDLTGKRDELTQNDSLREWFDEAAVSLARIVDWTGNAAKGFVQIGDSIGYLIAQGQNVADLSSKQWQDKWNPVKQFENIKAAIPVFKAVREEYANNFHERWLTENKSLADKVIENQQARKRKDSGFINPLENTSNGAEKKRLTYSGAGSDAGRKALEEQKRIDDNFAQQSLALTKDIAKSETLIANIRAGIFEEDGQHVAAMREWLLYDEEGVKLDQARKNYLLQRAEQADKLAVTAKVERDHHEFMVKADQQRIKDERDILAIRETGSGARYTAADDWSMSDEAKKLLQYDPGKYYQQYAVKLAEDERAKQKTSSSYLYTLQEQEKNLSRQIQLLGMSTHEQEKQQALWQAEEEFKASIAGMDESDLEYQRMKTAYLQQQAEIERASATRRNFDRDPQAQSEKALRDYADEATNLGAQVSEAWKGAFTSMEDALTEFATTGKLSFKDMADQIIADLLRIQIRSQITGPLAQMMSGQSGLGAAGNLSSWIGNFGSSGYEASSDSYFSSSGSGLLGWLGGLFGGARAEGGPVASGSLYRVNERGPELLSVGGRDYLMMGSQSGAVTPNHQLGGKSVNVRISQSFAPGTDKKTADQAGLAAARAINRAQRRNG